MTTEQQDAIIGRLIRKRQEAKVVRVAIEEESRRIGERLSELGKAISKNLSCVCGVGEEMKDESILIGPPVRILSEDVSLVSKALVFAAEYRDTLQKIADTNKQLSAIGWKD